MRLFPPFPPRCLLHVPSTPSTAPRPPHHPWAQLLAFEPDRLLRWIPLFAASAGLVILLALRLAAPPYVGILAFVMAYSSLALAGPRSIREPLLAHAARVYAAVLLLAWVTALYLLPGHPATAMVRLAVLLHLTTVYVSLFIQLPP
ncbi:hypothetical protein ACFP9V_22640 [Deinococcus radiopugnans]|uniref:hypothetical protein n=1 Tax=Deinococcus radiopugnans TaxID=57497 RepID=UPI00361AAEEF